VRFAFDEAAAAGMPVSLRQRPVRAPLELRAEFVSLGAFLEALAEFDRRRLYRTLGHADLFGYLHKGLKLSRAAAHHRRAAAWLVQRFPEVLEPIREGKLCFTTAAVLASVATEENLAAVLPRFYGLSKQEALELAAELKPRTSVPTRTVVTRVQPSRPVDPVAEVKQTVPEIRPGELWAPRTGVERTEVERTVVEPMTATSSRMHVTVSREFLALLKKAKAGDSHRRQAASDEEVLTAALMLLIEKQAKRKASVPAKVKREVVKRDEGKCRRSRTAGSSAGRTTSRPHARPTGTRTWTCSPVVDLPAPPRWRGKTSRPTGQDSSPPATPSPTPAGPGRSPRPTAVPDRPCP
jgi:hypothetical protein